MVKSGCTTTAPPSPVYGHATVPTQIAVASTDRDREPRVPSVISLLTLPRDLITQPQMQQPLILDDADGLPTGRGSSRLQQPGTHTDRRQLLRSRAAD